MGVEWARSSHVLCIGSIEIMTKMSSFLDMCVYTLHVYM